MIYTLEKYEDLLKQKVKEKRKTLLVSGVVFLAIIALIVVIFAFKLPYLSIIGWVASVFLFCYIYSRVALVHKKYKSYTDFYYDILYGEKTPTEIVFLGGEKKTISAGRTFKSISAYDVKEDRRITLLFDENYSLDMQEGKKYYIEKTENVLVGYSLIGEDSNV